MNEIPIHATYDRDARATTLRGFGALGDTLPALLEYTENPYAQMPGTISTVFPLEDEAHVEAWRGYVSEAESAGAAVVLQRRLVQLDFPVREGMSEDPAYLAATRRGQRPSSADAFPFEDPDGVELSIHPTAAGALPMIVVHNRSDFELLARALAYRNEPADIPASMGACFVSGLINWDRVTTYRRSWELRTPNASEEAWQEEFKSFAKRKELYQDRVMILSTTPYAGLSAEEVDRPAEEWARESLVLRREHECFHYVTWRLFGVVRSNLLDELIADFVGLLAAQGAYRADLALRFLGIAEDETRLPDGARLELYRGQPPLPDEALPPLLALARSVVRNMATAATIRGDLSDPDRARELALAVASLYLEELSASDCLERLASRLHGVRLAMESSTAETVWTFQCRSTREGITACLDNFEESSAYELLPLRLRRKLGLVLDEILSNIQKYAYGDTEGEISLAMAQGDHGFTLTVEDRGREFNPLYVAAPEEVDLVTPRKPGGLGIYLVRHLAADLHYDRTNDVNRLTVELDS